MSELRCETVQERIPDLVAGFLDEQEAHRLRAHAEACAECGDMLSVVALLRSSRGVAPAGLAQRIEGSVRFRRRSVARPWWGLAAAAVAALALGIGVTSEPGATPEVPAFVAEAAGAPVWFAEDGVIAGAPTFGDLTDEALQTLLEEMSSGPSGGAA